MPTQLVEREVDDDPVQPAAQRPLYEFGSDVFAASFASGRLGGPVAIPAASGCGEVVTRGGPTLDGGRWFACASGGSSLTMVRRLAADGTALGDTSVPGVRGVEGDMTALSPDGRALFVWNPLTATVTRVDVGTGETATGRGPAQAAASTGVLGVLGAWLAPTAAAKTYAGGFDHGVRRRRRLGEARQRPARRGNAAVPRARHRLTGAGPADIDSRRRPDDGFETVEVRPG